MRGTWATGPPGDGKEGDGYQKVLAREAKRQLKRDKQRAVEKARREKEVEENRLLREAREKAEQERQALEAARGEEKVDEDCGPQEGGAGGHGRSLETNGGARETWRPAGGGRASGAVMGGRGRGQAGGRWGQRGAGRVAQGRGGLVRRSAEEEGLGGESCGRAAPSVAGHIP